ncbi:MAG TPA: erythromycin esterase family protein, partial [Gemmatimonadales bacterium]|nr:erythromycin esterase family protein [Gemmatimonadales bacterium]
RQLVHALEEAAYPLAGEPGDFDPILARARRAQFVLIGEASHGTHEFYHVRAEITKRLIREAGFTAVAVEADWPDAYRVNRYVRGDSADRDATGALSDFHRFPQWMWRNADVLGFVGWLREYNAGRPDADQAGFYGLDLYSLHASMEKVLEYLDVVDPDGARRARARYACFDHFGGDPQAYGYAASTGLARSCEDEVVQQLVELRRSAALHRRRDGRTAADEQFFAEQNARIVSSAEEYYRAMFGGRVESWNLRDRHMVDTLNALVAHLEKTRGRAEKVVVWAHNSHLGDARATELGAAGEWNVGQLLREAHGHAAQLVGFLTHTGTVTAASNWDAPAERKVVRPSLPGSYEALCHETGRAAFLLDLRERNDAVAALGDARLERAIGVIYRPETERASHYFRAVLPKQFDAVLFYDETRALEPLQRTVEWDQAEVPETYPSAL